MENHPEQINHCFHFFSIALLVYWRCKTMSHPSRVSSDIWIIFQPAPHTGHPTLSLGASTSLRVRKRELPPFEHVWVLHYYIKLVMDTGYLNAYIYLSTYLSISLSLQRSVAARLRDEIFCFASSCMRQWTLPLGRAMYSRAVHPGRRLSAGLSCQRTSARVAANGGGSVHAGRGRKLCQAASSPS